eukprot:4287831-Amphidinium_carterae.1
MDEPQNVGNSLFFKGRFLFCSKVPLSVLWCDFQTGSSLSLFLHYRGSFVLVTNLICYRARIKLEFHFTTHSDFRAVNGARNPLIQIQS